MNFKNFYFNEISMVADIKLNNVFDFNSNLNNIKVYTLELPHYLNQFGITINENYMNKIRIDDDILEIPVKSQAEGAIITDRQIQMLKNNLVILNKQSVGEIEPWMEKENLNIVDVEATKLSPDKNILSIVFNKELVLYRSKHIES